MMRRTLFCSAVVLMIAANAWAQETIFLVRHAERADTASGSPATMASDPDLSEPGRTRAESLASLLKDAGISAIYVTEYKRTQQTAAPLAQRLGIRPTLIPAKDVEGLVARLKAMKTPALVVGHSNSVPDVIQALGVTPALTIADTEFDNLFIVTPPARLIRLRYH